MEVVNQVLKQKTSSDTVLILKDSESILCIFLITNNLEKQKSNQYGHFQKAEDKCGYKQGVTNNLVKSKLLIIC